MIFLLYTPLWENSRIFFDTNCLSLIFCSLFLFSYIMYVRWSISILLTFVRSWWRYQMETFSALLALFAGIHRSPVNSPHKGHWRGALIFSLICAWINGWVNHRDAGDLRRHCAHYAITVMNGLESKCDKPLLDSMLTLFHQPIWTIYHHLGVGHEIMVSTVCLSMFWNH